MGIELGQPSKSLGYKLHESRDHGLGFAGGFGGAEGGWFFYLFYFYIILVSSLLRTGPTIW